MSATAKVLRWPVARRPEPEIVSPFPAFVLTPPEMLPEKKTRKAPRRKPPVSLTATELLAVLTLAYSTCVRDWVLILLTYWHGLRASEAVNLRESDFDLAAGTVLVKRGKGSEGGYQALQEHENPLLNERAAVGWWLANRAQFGVKGTAKPGARKRNIIPAKTLQSTEIVKFSPDEPNTSHFPPSFEGAKQEVEDITGRTLYVPIPRASLGAPGEKPAGGPKPLPDTLTFASGPPCANAGHSFDDAQDGPGGVSFPQNLPGANTTKSVVYNQKSCFPPSSPEARLFPISRVRFWQLVHGYALSVGIPRRKCKTHMLKHTIAKHLIRNGVPINEVQAWLGWKSLETANWYLMADEDELGDRVGKAIRGMGGFRQVQQGSLF